MTTVSWRRLRALCVKESRQILRDPSSGVVAFVLPMLLLVIFGYGINLDTDLLRLGLCDEDGGREATRFASQLTGSPYFAVTEGSRPTLDRLLEDGVIRGYVVVPADFSARLSQGQLPAQIQVITDGTEPNTANFVAAYTKNAWQEWRQTRARDLGRSVPRGTDMEVRHWFNPSAISRHYLIPGSIVIIMTVIGAMLTSLVVAREWERGTMEALLASPVTRAELLLSKLLPYYSLGMISMAVVVFSSVFVMGVPFRGSVAALGLVTTVFLLSMLGIGLFISSAMRNQFDSAQTTLNVAFLPAAMLSGAFFVISSMPAPIRALTYLLPPRYFVSSLQTIFLAGDVWAIIIPDVAFLTGTSILFLALTALKTTHRLDG
ncbi:MAG: ABC transporter permease [Deltaproteobacteria bacterium]|nr:ABC transporter permease [Deltaproteobacteria bacterium]